MTFKHGGIAFILAYLAALLTVAIPMLILELTLGQKMQKGSAGAIRGITPRLGGIGWVASFAGFITCLVYVMFLSMPLIYLFRNASEPWDLKFKDREVSCKTAERASASGAEIFLHTEITRFFSPETCQPYKYGEEPFYFSGALFLCCVFTWFICYLVLLKGTKSIGYTVLVSVTTPFILLIILMVYYIQLSASNPTEGEVAVAGGEPRQITGMDIYWGRDPLPLVVPDAEGNLNYDPASVRDKIFSDAVNLAFFSVGVCVVLMQAYASYSPIK